jgi:hypothetical protein
MKTLLFTFTFFLLFSACNSSDQKEPEPIQTIQSGSLDVLNGWVRPGKAGMMSAAYFTISNGTASADSLLSIHTILASDTQIHETYAKEDGLMGMRPIGLVPIASGEQVDLKPGGMHIMLIQPTKDLAEGDSVEFSLQFAESAEQWITLPVRPAN